MDEYYYYHTHARIHLKSGIPLKPKSFLLDLKHFFYSYLDVCNHHHHQYETKKKKKLAASKSNLISYIAKKMTLTTKQNKKSNHFTIGMDSISKSKKEELNDAKGTHKVKLQNKI